MNTDKLILKIYKNFMEQAWSCSQKSKIHRPSSKADFSVGFIKGIQTAVFVMQDLYCQKEEPRKKKE